LHVVLDYKKEQKERVIEYKKKNSTPGFISNGLDFTNAVKIAAMPDTLKHKIVASAVKSSFSIHCNRNTAALDAP
jgi:hypothetical protein